NQLGHVFGDRVVDAAEAPLRDGDSHQRREERLGHRERGHHRVARGAVVVALGQELITVEHEEGGRPGLGHELVEITFDHAIVGPASGSVGGLSSNPWPALGKIATVMSFPSAFTLSRMEMLSSTGVRWSAVPNSHRPGTVSCLRYGSGSKPDDPPSFRRREISARESWPCSPEASRS